jgi:hypothetical protein
MKGAVDVYCFEEEYKCECIGCVVDKCLQQWALWQHLMIFGLNSSLISPPRGGVELGGVRKESTGLASDSPLFPQGNDDT